MRKRCLVVGMNTYTWFVGRSFVEIRIAIGGGSCTFLRVPFEAVTGLTPSDLPLGYDMSLEITHSMIERLIRDEWSVRERATHIREEP